MLVCFTQGSKKSHVLIPHNCGSSESLFSQGDGPHFLTTALRWCSSVLMVHPVKYTLVCVGYCKNEYRSDDSPLMNTNTSRHTVQSNSNFFSILSDINLHGIYVRGRGKRMELKVPAACLMLLTFRLLFYTWICFFVAHYLICIADLMMLHVQNIFSHSKS